MRSLAEISDRSSPLIEMMNERSGLWRIDQDRVDLISRHRKSLSARNAEVADDMIRAAESGERFWKCTGEYFAVLTEIKSLSDAPSASEIKETLDMVVLSAKRDRVDHREWVKKAISLLTRLSEAE